MKRLLFKSIIAMAVFAVFGLSAQAQVNWHTIGDASKAQIGTRLYFVDFYTTWCVWCKRMDRDEDGGKVRERQGHRYDTGGSCGTVFQYIIDLRTGHQDRSAVQAERFPVKRVFPL